MMVLSCSNLKFVVSEVSQELTLNSQTEIERHNIIFWLRGRSTNTHKHIHTHKHAHIYVQIRVQPSLTKYVQNMNCSKNIQDNN